MSKKLLHLQGLRGVAILSVVAFHFFPKWFKNGYLGVDVFFLLSGYLMTMMLDQKETIWLPELANFWFRRMKRIVPFYYLATLGILLCLFLSNGMVQSANAGPAMNALLLATNLIRPSGDDGYFEKLGLAVDMFTHTWSLALEMQFYLIFPFIFVIFKAIPDRFAPLFVLATATASFAYQTHTDDFTAFNSVFARIWQFLAGMAAFYADAWFSPNEKESVEKEDLISEFTSSRRPPSETILLNIFISALITLLLFPREVNLLYARFNSILIAFVIVTYCRNCYLENRILVFIGEISYGWYLVHWPVYALFKVNELNEDYYLLWGAVLSLLISIILHYSFEKHYLGWSKAIIINVVVLLLLCNGIALQNLKASVDKPDDKILNGTVLSMGNESKRLDPIYFWPSDFLDKIVYGFENMTEKERYSLNDQYDSGDSARTLSYCKNFTITKNSKERRCHMNYFTNKTANQSILIIGNSWAGNLMQPVAESCSHRFSDMMTVFQSGCEPLIMSDQDGYYGCSQDHMFLDAIKEMKPDVLMVLVRYCESSELLNGTSPLNDQRFKLGLAVDMFTHTWSLALEMQFYLIFPFIFVIFKAIPDRFAPLFVLATATASFAYQTHTDDFTAFNSVFARIWQFLAGMAAFYADAWFSPNEKESVEKEDLISEFTSSRRPPSETILLNIFISALITLLLFPREVNLLYARFNSILIAFVIVTYCRNCYLENRILVFIGEISYGWYLVHWPVYALFKVNELNEDYYLLWGAVLSLLISIILHYSFEKHYLGWSKAIIINVVVLLLLCNGIALQNLKASVDKPDDKILNGTVLSMGNESKRLDPIYFWPSDFLDKIVYGFENMTEKERYSLNDQYDSGDSARTLSYRKNFTITKNSKERRCHMNYFTNKTANQSILIIGNSWAGNLMQPVAESCSHRFSDMMTVFQSGCEPLIMSDQDGYYGCSQDHMFLDAIKEMKPDVLMVLVRYCESSELLNGTSPLNDQRFKLGLAVDMFTHTWSLALEMQFYLIFPFIFVIFKAIPDRFAPLFVLATATASFAYQTHTDDFTAFNSVFARIWQFLAGMAASYADAWFSPNEKESVEKEDLISEFTSSRRPPSETILLNIFISALITLLLFPREVNPLYARFNSILIAFVIVTYCRNCYLENRILVFIGEISYGWYLVHWPVYALFKVNELNEDYYLLWGAVLSLLISIILHYSFEKHYLGWSKAIIINVVVLLLLCNGIALQNLKASVDKPDDKILNGTVLSMGNESKRLDPIYFWPSDFLDKIVYGFENMTEKERYSLNDQYDSGDSARTLSYCKNFTITKNSKERRCHMNYFTNKTANQSILIIGNSWAGNLMQPVAESCSHRFSDMMTVFQSGCEPLIMSDQDGYYGCSQDHMFLDAIKEMKPDVLMVLVRYCESSELLNGTSPLNDQRFKLGLAVDMFTHTWSLALEMQFYLIFPFIFVIFKAIPDRFAPLFVLATATASFAYQTHTDDFTAFNSVFARIWQFLAGMAAFYADAWFSPNEKESVEKEDLISEFTSSRRPPSETILLNIFISALITLLLFPREVNLLYARFNSILIAFVIVTYCRNCYLENRILVFIGEISYGWYLVHWPVYALFKVNELNEDYYLLWGAVLSLLISIILHYSFEKHYLGWSKAIIINVVVLLLLCNGIALQNLKASVDKPDDKILNGTVLSMGNESKRLDPIYFWPSDFLDKIVYGFENMTEKERYSLNDQYDSGDSARTLSYRKNFTITKNSKERRCHMNYFTNKTANQSILIIGNSWAGNLMQPVAESCSHRFSDMMTVFQSGCEPLIMSDQDGYYGCSQDHMFLDAIKEMKPDVLMVLVRYCESSELLNGTSPLNDQRFKLGLAVDMFTHTWSLALEMQFYLIFPFIFVIFKAIPDRFAPLFVLATATASFAYQTHTDDFTAFNSVFARIWQFLAGMAASYADAWFSPNEKESVEKEDLISEFTSSRRPPSETILLNIFISALITLLLFPREVNPLYARFNSILIAFVIVTYCRNCYLENRILVFIGEISYGWYLVHWPVYALFKVNELNEDYYLLWGAVLSLLISIILHYSFEKHYLGWSKAIIINVVVLLLLCNGIALQNLKASVDKPDDKILNGTVLSMGNESKRLDPIYFWPSDFLDKIVYGFENMTEKERYSLNDQYDSGDSARTLSYCKNFTITKNSKERRCHMNYFTNKTANQSILIIGNSWAGNLMQPVAESCSHRFSDMMTVFQSGCEPLIMSDQDGYYGCSQDHMFLDAIKEMKPDVLMVLVRYCESSELLNGTSPLNDQRFKLGLAVDMFTHTWSLALEMQFYLIFPFIFVIFKAIPDRFAPLFVLATATASFAYQTHTDDFTAFNSVFARIWQFLAGMAAFYADAWFSPNEKESVEKEDLISEFTSSRRPPSETILLNIFISALITLLLFPREVNLLYARFNSILIAFVIVTYCRNCYLENRILVFIGEISYGWYLVHWPVYALFKVNELNEDYYLLWGAVLSLLISIILHYSFEKHYLGWSKAIIINVVVLLLLCNGIALQNLKASVDKPDDKILNGTVLSMGNESKRLDPIYFWPSDFLDKIVYGFENMTEKERYSLNDQYDSGDSARTLSYRKNFTITKNSKERRCHMNYFTNKTANQSILIIGNSWAGNLMQPVAESCSHRFSDMMTVFQSGCEPLIMSDQDGYYGCSQDHMFLDAIKEMKPDVLMVLVRYCESSELLNGTSPLNDQRFKAAAERIAEWQKYVKKRILILDAFPLPKKNLMPSLQAMLSGENVSKEDYFSVDNRYLILKQRIARLVDKCEKCRVFDFATQFWFNGAFRLYEPKYKVSFMSTPFHLTPAGWVRVKPLLKYVCENA